RVEELQPVETAPLEPDVEEDEVRPARHHRSERLVAVGGRAGAVAFVLQDAGDQLADIRLIVYDQDVGCHDQTAIVLLSADAAGAVGSAGVAGSSSSAIKRSCIHAPRAPGIFSAASCSSICPPCSSRMRPTM